MAIQAVPILPNYLDIGHQIRRLLLPTFYPRLSNTPSGNFGTSTTTEFSYIDLKPDIKRQIQQLLNPLFGQSTITYDVDFLFAVRSLIVGGAVYDPIAQRPQRPLIADTTPNLDVDMKADVALLFDEYKRRLKTLDCSTICGLVWTSQYYAYRCRTCALSPCMSLCATCFRAADHIGHDFNMFKSHAGGACDCGDESVMRPNGFCSKHGVENTLKNRAARPSVPPELVAVPRLVVEHLIARLVLELRANAAGDERLASIDPLFEFLNSMLDCGSVFRELIISILLDPAFFEAHEIRSLDQRDCLPPAPLTSNGFDAGSINTESGHAAIIDLVKDFTDDLGSPQESLRSARTRAQPSRAHESSSERDRLARAVQAELSAIRYGRPLEELVFWLIFFKLPQSLVTFLLNQLPDENMKEQFARVFTRQYVLVTQPLASSPSDELQSLANRVVHVSVQLLSNEALARALVVEERMLDRLLLSLRLLLAGSLTRCKFLLRCDPSTLAAQSSSELAAAAAASGSGSTFSTSAEFASLSSSIPPPATASAHTAQSAAAMDTSSSPSSPAFHDAADSAEHYSEESEHDSSAVDSSSDSSSAVDLSALTSIVPHPRLVPSKSGQGLVREFRRVHEPRHWPRALDCTTELLRTHSYWPYTSDFINVRLYNTLCLKSKFKDHNTSFYN